MTEYHLISQTLILNLETLLLTLQRNGKTRKLYSICRIMIKKFDQYVMNSGRIKELFIKLCHVSVLSPIVSFGLSNMRHISPRESSNGWEKLNNMLSLLKKDETKMKNLQRVFTCAKE